MRIEAFCTLDCMHWQKEVDTITAGEVAALDNPVPQSEE